MYQFTAKISVVARDGQTGESTAWLTDAIRPDASANPLFELPVAQYLLANPTKTLKSVDIFRDPFGGRVSLREFLETVSPAIITTKNSCFIPICARFKLALKGLVRSDAYNRLVWSQWVDNVDLVAIPKRDALEEANPEERDALEAMYAPPPLRRRLPPAPPPTHRRHPQICRGQPDRRLSGYHAGARLPSTAASDGEYGPGHINSQTTAATATACICHGRHPKSVSWDSTTLCATRNSPIEPSHAR